MKASSDKILSYLANNANIDLVTTEDLQLQADEHPYFPVGQFLLAKKLQAENSPAYLAQAQKTALYFSSPYWLHYQLTTAQSEITEEVAQAQIISSDRTEEETTETLAVEDDTHPITTVFSEQEIVAASDLAHETLQEQDEVEDLSAAEFKEHELVEVEEPAIAEKPEHDAPTDQAEEEAAAIARDADKETEQFIETPDASTEIEQDTLDKNVIDSLTPAGETAAIETLEEMSGVTYTDTSAPFVEDAEQYTNPENVDNAASEPSLEEDNETEPDEHDQMFQNIKAMLDASSEEADADIENALIPIDPYYTIDYFASQGIKIEFDQNPQDQLGQNLKKFTHWLRHMKKLGPEDATEAIIRTETDSDIQKIADSSNTVREVVTEAMASVLEKQGKKDKAIELYNKLSFLNPDKSAYFANQIKKLKGTWDDNFISYSDRFG